jgi:hypothetical protein
MSTPEQAVAVYIDFDNVAIGVREAGGVFDVRRLMERIVEEGRVILRRAYADWTGHTAMKKALHEAGFELIDIPARAWSGKNAADIKLVVDALDLCHQAPAIDTFVIVSGDSDFTPLVARLRQHHRRVIGVGVEHASSSLLIDACDSFVFYDELLLRRTRAAPGPDTTATAALDWVVDTIEAMDRDRDGALWSSMIKQTLKRKRPGFSERRHGFRSFNDLIEEAARRDFIEIEKDAPSGGYRITAVTRPEAAVAK